jgi:hypothetical protein
VLNAADYGDATTRERFFLIGRTDGKRLTWPTPSHSRDGAVDGMADLLGHQPRKWKSARDHVIDWSIAGQSIFGRKKGLAPKTLDRIIAGGLKFKWPAQLIEAIRLELLRQLIATIQKSQVAMKRERKKKKRAARLQTIDWCAARITRLCGELGSAAPASVDGAELAPMLVTFRRHADGRRLTDPLPGLTAGGTHHGIAEPFVLSPQSNGAPRSTGEPIMTLTTGGAACDERPGCARPAVIDGFILNRHGDNGTVRAHSLDEPAPTADCRGAGYVVDPALINLKGRSTALSVDSPAPGLTAHAGHLAVAEAVVCGNRTNNTPKSTDEPLGGMTGSTGGGFFVAEPLVMRSDQTGGGGLNVRSAAEPIFTATGNSGGGLAVVEPFIATVAHGNEAGDQGADARRCRSADEPLQTLQAGGGKFAKVEGFMLSQASGGAPRDVGDPVPAIPGGGAHALIAPYYGSGSGLTCKTAAEPLDTLTAKARFGLVVGVTHTKGGGPAPRSLEQPLPGITTAKGGELALVMPVTHGGDKGRVRSADETPPTITAAPRGELALIVAAFGERDGQAPRFHSVEQPVPAICASGRIQIACGLIAGEDFDVRFRMLDPRRELARAMSFSTEDVEYEFIGTKTEVTKMIGNAVPVETACALVSALFRV